MKCLKDADDLRQRLDSLGDAITTHVDSPNYGGCGVIAGCVGRALQKLDVLCEVVTPVACGREPASAVRANVTNPGSAKDWDRNGLSRSHLAVRFRYDGTTYCWDSNGLYEGGDKFGHYSTTAEFGDGLTVSECVKISSRQAGWNRDFDRRQIPLIKHLVQHHLLYGLEGEVR